MLSNIGNDPIAGGGEAEKTYRGFMTEQYADSISRSGGIGIADQIYRELVRIQENAQ